jgi:hypothetical protein
MKKELWKQACLSHQTNIFSHGGDHMHVFQQTDADETVHHRHGGEHREDDVYFVSELRRLGDKR